MQGFGLQAYRQILDDPQFRHTLWFSVQLALETTVGHDALMVPTVYWVHLRLPKVRPGRSRRSPSCRSSCRRSCSSSGCSTSSARSRPTGCCRTSSSRPSSWSRPTSCSRCPFVYRALDAGVRAIDIQTLTEAAESLGASRTRTLFRVILPNLREAVLAACLLTFVIVLGEFTIASIALYQTFPVYITTIGTAQAYPAAALTIIAVGLTFLASAVFLVLGRMGLRRRRQPALGVAMTGVGATAGPNVGDA